LGRKASTERSGGADGNALAVAFPHDRAGPVGAKNPGSGAFEGCERLAMRVTEAIADAARDDGVAGADGGEKGRCRGRATAVVTDLEQVGAKCWAPPVDEPLFRTVLGVAREEGYVFAVGDAQDEGVVVGVDEGDGFR